MAQGKLKIKTKLPQTVKSKSNKKGSAITKTKSESPFKIKNSLL